MLNRLRSIGSRIWAWFKGLPVGVAVGIAVVVFGGFITASVFSYRTWDYIQNDNDFCMGCHLMAEPFDLFGESAHRDLGCKACHHPNMFERAKMGAAQVIKNPDSLTVHAEVDNESCASCHVTGSPEEWTLIAASAGHRVHFESDDPELEGLMCVECHSNGVHQFGSKDETCRECHEEARVIMAGMNTLDMSCLACHAFNAPVEGLGGPGVTAEGTLVPAPEGALESILTPTDQECLSCHVMRVAVTMPENDPHERTCGACHNPHTQETAEEAGSGCTVAGCHDGPAEEVSPFHSGLAPGTLETCTDCHSAHDFHSEGQDCLTCHTDIFRDERRTAPDDAASGEFSGSSAVHGAAPPPAGFLGLGALHAPTPVRVAPQAAPMPDSVFRHAQHRDVACLSCHSTETSHGAVTIQALGGCRQCHHSEPLANDCTRCHAPDAPAAGPVRQAVTFSLPEGAAVTRDIAFDHAAHEGTACTECHSGGVGMAVEQPDCTRCHEEHHEATGGCAACHSGAPRDEHTVDAHIGCTGAGCHEEAGIRDVTSERALCVVCHAEQADHMPDATESCADCHALPHPATGPGAPS